VVRAMEDVPLEGDERQPRAEARGERREEEPAEARRATEKP
jgi:hypothetical protein